MRVSEYICWNLYLFPNVKTFLWFSEKKRGEEREERRREETRRGEEERGEGKRRRRGEWSFYYYIYI